jgi:hypothetical protein
MAVIGDGAPTCTNCGGPGDVLEPVHRVYLSVDEEGRVTGSEAVPLAEWWCVSCRSLYPHEATADHAPDTDRGP